MGYKIFRKLLNKSKKTYANMFAVPTSQFTIALFLVFLLTLCRESSPLVVSSPLSNIVNGKDAAIVPLTHEEKRELIRKLRVSQHDVMMDIRKTRAVINDIRSKSIQPLVSRLWEILPLRDIGNYNDQVHAIRERIHFFRDISQGYRSMAGTYLKMHRVFANRIWQLERKIRKG